MSKCVKCDTAEAAWEWPCLKIDETVTDEAVNSLEAIREYGAGQTYKRTTTQSIRGVCNAGLCPECEKKLILPKYNKRPASVIASACITALLAAGWIKVSVGGSSDSDAPTLPAGTILILAAAAAVITLVLWFLHSKKVNRILTEKLNEPLEKRCLLLGQVKEEPAEKPRPRYVPLGDGFYPDEDAFMTVNPHLLPDMYTHLYEKVISEDQWKTLHIPEPKQPR